MTENKRFTYRFNKEDDGEFEIIDFDDDAYYGMDTTENCVRELVKLLNELHDEKQSVIDWIDRKIEEIKPYNSELCRATLLELKEFLE